MSLKIDLKIFLFLFLFLLTSQIEMYIILMIFAIIHELGHLVAGLILKFKPEEVKLTPVGLQIRFKIDSREYNEKIKEARSLKPGDVVVIPAGVKHWHGAKKDSWFSHIAFEVPGENTSNEWCEPVSDEEYNKLN